MWSSGSGSGSEAVKSSASYLIAFQEILAYERLCVAMLHN
jgi:hypothetical protein